MRDPSIPKADGANFRNLVICIDDVTNTQHKTNVRKMTDTLEGFPLSTERQLVFYYRMEDKIEPKKTLSDKLRRGSDESRGGKDNDPVTAALEAYKWLSENYEDGGDRVFILGGGQGAYMARAIAGMLCTVKVTPKATDDVARETWNAYLAASRGLNNMDKTRKMAQVFRKKQIGGLRVNVHFLGLWDTITPHKTFFSAQPPLLRSLQVATFIRHAVAYQENQHWLDPHPFVTRWTAEKEAYRATPSGNIHTMETFFLGDHRDLCGGALPEKDLQLSNIPLRWIARESSIAGLLFSLNKLVQCPAISKAPLIGQDNTHIVTTLRSLTLQGSRDQLDAQALTMLEQANLSATYHEQTSVRQAYARGDIAVSGVPWVINRRRPCKWIQSALARVTDTRRLGAQQWVHISIQDQPRGGDDTCYVKQCRD